MPQEINEELYDIWDEYSKRDFQYVRGGDEDVSVFSFRLFTLWDILVKELYPASAIFFNLQSIEHILCRLEITPRGTPWLLEEAMVARAHMDTLVSRFNIPLSKILVEEIHHDILDGTICSHEELASRMREFVKRVEHEFRSYVFLYIPQDQINYYVHPTQGWEKIFERWGNTVSDIEEAGKCFALNRYAASVFHSLQVVEFGLIELGKFLRVHDPKSGWTAVAGELRNIMNKTYMARSDFEKEHSPFLEQVQATVEALKNAWRNKISHALRKAHAYVG